MIDLFIYPSLHQKKSKHTKTNRKASFNDLEIHMKTSNCEKGNNKE